METGMKDPSTLTRTPAAGPPPRTGVRPPVVERIAGWSARHRAIALIGWLLLVAGAVMIGNTLGTKNLNSYDPGEAGRAERVLSSPGVVQRATESVLVQERASGRTIAADPQARAAIRQVEVALERIPRVATNVQSPLLLAGTAVATAISLLAIPSRWLPIGSTTSSVVLLVGMAVGIDYSLFYLRREREERAAGASQAEALRTAAATSGRAIVVSGLTVMISLAGLFLTSIDVFTGIAVGTITVVGVAVIGSLTALPALLSLLGTWVDKGKIPFLGRRRTAARRSAFWNALVRRVVARPVLWGGTAALALVALTIPAFNMRLADPGLHDLPTSVPVVRNLLAIQHSFPGGPTPAEVVVTGKDLSGQPVREAVAALQERAGTSGPLREPVTATLLGHGRVLVVSVPLAGDGTDRTSISALETLRNHALPATLGKVSGISYAVAGNTASTHDFSARMHGRAPIVFAFVLGLAFLLLLLTFRSVAIPLMSIGLNLLSVGAAYGLLTLIFQDGHLSRLLGFSPYGGIVTWMPLFLFVLLFGLSMDYHVFILSRIRELRLRGWTTPQAITGGIGGSAGVVTSAAVIMVAVFSIFATLSLIEFKMFGVAMAAAVLIDATVVRGVLMPASMSLLGERNWYLPRWLSWLPGQRQAVPAAGEAARKEMAGTATGR